jgi:hypothetical protein
MSGDDVQPPPLPPQYQQPYQPPSSYAAPVAVAPPQRTSAWAIASLVLSLTVLVGFVLIGPLLAVIFGHLAQREIKRSQGLVGGGGLATAGLIIGYIGILLSVAVCGYAGYAVYLFTSYPP